MKARFVTRLPEPRFYTCKMRRCGMFQYGLVADLGRVAASCDM